MARRKTRAPSPRPALASPLNLVAFRQKSGISLEDIAETTKISMRFLRAIEDEEFSQLPGGIFNTSYLRQYAAAIGFEESVLLAHYERRINPSPTAEASSSEPERSLFDRWFRIAAHALRS